MCHKWWIVHCHKVVETASILAWNSSKAGKDKCSNWMWKPTIHVFTRRNPSCKGLKKKHNSDLTTWLAVTVVGAPWHLPIRSLENRAPPKSHHFPNSNCSQNGTMEYQFWIKRTHIRMISLFNRLRGNLQETPYLMGEGKNTKKHCFLQIFPFNETIDPCNRWWVHVFRCESTCFTNHNASASFGALPCSMW